MVQVDILGEQDDAEYVAFLDGLGLHHPGVLGYHYPTYRQMLTTIGVGAPFYLGARSDGKLVGVLPGFVRATDIGTVYSSLPFFGPNSGVLCAGGAAEGEIHQALIQAAIENLQQQKNALSASFYTPFLFDRYEHYDNALVEPVIVDRFTQSLYLPDAKWDKKIRYDLRQTQRAGLEISTQYDAQLVDRFYEIYLQNCIDNGIPTKPRAVVDFLLESGVAAHRVGSYFAFHNGVLVGGLLVIWGATTASYYMPCMVESARALQPGTALIDRAVEDARSRGIQHWNWEGSPSRESGVYQFKKKWGAAESGFRIYIHAFHTSEEFRQIGPQQIMSAFPYFFVYPFQSLVKK